MAKTLRLWNGHFRSDSVYVAAYSAAEAVRLLRQADLPERPTHFKTHWSEAWGTSTQAEIGLPAEPCVWIQRYSESKVLRRLLPAPNIAVPTSARNPLVPSPSLCIKLAKLVRPSHVVWHDDEVQNWVRQMKNLGYSE